jgi:glycosyltransferase involved in cell wall biosynthesis
MSFGLPAVSVLMPAFNAEKYVAKSIESVLDQTFADFELLVIDDNSTDSTAAIIASYEQKDARVRGLKNTRKKGISGGLNTGLEMAKAELVARADADDLNRPDRFQRQVDFLAAHPEIFLVGGGYAPFTAEGRRGDILHPCSSVEIAWRFLSNTYFCHPTVMFRRSLVAEVGDYPYCASEDFVYFSRIVKKHRCANISTVLVDYREVESSWSRVEAARIAECVKGEFYKNYQYYIGSEREADTFYDFQNYNRARVRNVFKLLIINAVIIERIRKDYDMGSLDPQVRAIRRKAASMCLWPLRRAVASIGSRAAQKLRLLLRRISGW